MSNTKTREIKTKFSIEGEKQLKNALSENTAQAKELKSEMNLLDASFEGATDSEEYLAKKTDILARQTQNAQNKVDLYEDALKKAIEQQDKGAKALDESRAKIAQQEKALDAAKAAYGENSEEVQKLSQELDYNRKIVANQETQLSKANKAVLSYKTSTNNAKTSVVELTKRQDKGAKAVKNLGDASDDTAGSNSELSDITGKLADKLGIELPDGASLATGSVGAVSAGVTAGIAVFKLYIETIAAVINKMVEISTEAAEWAVETEKLSAQTGMSVERIQELNYAAGQYGVEIDKIADSTKDLSQSLDAAQDPTSDEAALFRELGISIKDANGEVKSSGEIWEPLMERLSRIEDRTKQAAIANDLMGESYFDLQPILQDYAKFQSTANSAAAENAALSEEEVAKLTDVNASYQKLNNALENVKRALATQAADDMIAAMDEMTHVVNELGEYLVDSGAVESLGKYIEYLAKMVDLFLTLADLPGVGQFFDGVNWALDSMTNGLEIVTDLLDKILSQSDKVATALMGPLGTLVSSAANSAYKKSRGYASGTPAASGGVATVGEYGPERVYLPQGSRVLNARDTAAATGNTVYVTVNASVPDLATLQKIIDFYENYEITKRMG